MKTLEEKAESYTNLVDTRIFGSDEILDATTLMQQAYLTGATEALAGQWISVDDELPKDGKCVLVHIDHSDDTKRMDDFSKESLEDAIGHTIAYYRDGIWTFMDEYFYDCKIDRWMPIPEPPKTDKK